MYFGTKIYGSRLFEASLRKDQSDELIDALTVKLQIVRNTVRRLVDFYTRLHAATRPPTAPFLFPQPMALLQCLTPPPPAEIMAHLASMNLHILDNVDGTKDLMRSLYKGVIFESGVHVPVYVKIVAGPYGETAHRLLANHNPPYAPKLYWCHTIIAGYTMAVMGEVPTPLGLENPHPRNLNPDDIKIVSKDIRAAIHLLHEANLVHGDLRIPNMVISNGRGSLIDFDSAGMEGVVKYPWSLNSNITWPKDCDLLVRMPIWKDHDIFMFKRAIKELNEPPRPQPVPQVPPLPPPIVRALAGLAAAVPVPMDVDAEDAEHPSVRQFRQNYEEGRIIL